MEFYRERAKMKILLVDDDQYFLEIAKSWIGHDHETKVARDGFTALELMQNNKFDLAIIDLYMPEMSGIKLFDYIKKKYNIPIIVMSNQVTDEALQSLRHIEFRSLKPTTKKEFMNIIKKALNE
jgi:CheY-like chemotaxis protein